MSSSQQNKNLHNLLKAEEDANQMIREAKNYRTKIYKDIETQVDLYNLFLLSDISI